MKIRKSRYPELKKVNGKAICRGCGAEIPKGRHTWCSSKCYETRCPRMVIFAVRARDKGICQICGIETLHTPPRYQDRKWDALHRIFIEEEGWANFHIRVKEYRAQLKANYDHIIPFSEGGPTVVENMRTLCVQCHKERTKKWHADRKLRKSNSIAII